MEGRNFDNMFSSLHVVTCAILLEIAMLACKVAGSHFCFEGSMQSDLSNNHQGQTPLGSPI